MRITGVIFQDGVGSNREEIRILTGLGTKCGKEEWQGGQVTTAQGLMRYRHGHRPMDRNHLALLCAALGFLALAAVVADDATNPGG